jgi:hypothetical protein
MKNRRPTEHLSDEDLLLFAEREGSASHVARSREHLAQCQACRARMEQLQDTMAKFVAAHEEIVASRSGLDSETLARFKDRLSKAALQSAPPQPIRSANLFLRQLACAVVALAIVVGSAWGVRSLSPRRWSRASTYQQADALPRRTLTPGATRSADLSALCIEQDPENFSPVDPSLEQKVFTAYGLSFQSRQAYELDYLITPELGGATDIHNLWPEPYSSTVWNAHVKDELEDHLHQLVCQGKVPLSTAQNEISTDWIAAYKRYFHTDQPLTNAAGLEIRPAKRQPGGPADRTSNSPSS